MTTPKAERGVKDVTVGSRWYLWGRVKVVAEVGTEEKFPGYGVLVRLEPEEKPKGWKPHWTDWIERWRVQHYGRLLAPGEDAPRSGPTAADRAEAEVAKARKKRVVTPERRLANRITSTRYRLKHPEKSGRSEWSEAELRDMQETIDQAVAELAAMKEARNATA